MKLPKDLSPEERLTLLTLLHQRVFLSASPDGPVWDPEKHHDPYEFFEYLVEVFEAYELYPKEKERAMP